MSVRTSAGLLLLLVLLAGCNQFILVEIPESGARPGPASPRVAIAHVKDDRSIPDSAPKGEIRRDGTRPLTNDLFTEALRAALEDQGCMVAEIPDPSALEEGALRRFLAGHGFDGLIMGKVSKLSIDSSRGAFGHDSVTAGIEARILGARRANDAVETVSHTASRWGGFTSITRHDLSMNKVTSQAITGAARDLVSRPPIRGIIGLEAVGEDQAH